MNNLPVDCIATILSLTTPRVVHRSLAVSKKFKLAAESNTVWKRFFPPAEFPEGFTAPDLFFSLVKNPILHHGSRMSFWLERSSAKRCYMIAARGLTIIGGDDTMYWNWISLRNTRFNEVAEQTHDNVAQLDITGRINITLLSDDTLYAAYFVYSWSNGPCEFRHRILASLGTENDVVQSSIVFFQSSQLRSDGWLELKLGEYKKERGDMGELKMRVREHYNFFMKKGLIVHGIEIRPLP